MSQKWPVNGFKWAEKLSKFNERFIKSYNENSDKGYFLEVDVAYPKKNCLIFIRIYHFYQKEKKEEKVKKLICSIEDKEKCYSYKNLKTNIKSWINTKEYTEKFNLIKKHG